jgi:hypothetical protein
MSVAERDYFLERAEVELDLANRAYRAQTALAHYRLVAFYLDRANLGVANDD